MKEHTKNIFVILKVSDLLLLSKFFFQGLLQNELGSDKTTKYKATNASDPSNVLRSYLVTIINFGHQRGQEQKKGACLRSPQPLPRLVTPNP